MNPPPPQTHTYTVCDDIDYYNKHGTFRSVYLNLYSLNKKHLQNNIVSNQLSYPWTHVDHVSKLEVKVKVPFTLLIKLYFSFSRCKSRISKIILKCVTLICK